MYIKKPEEIEIITKAGRLMGEILEKLATMVVPGISAWEINQEAERMIREVGGEPAFKGYRTRATDSPYPATICACINAELVHGIPTKEKVLKDGDIFSIDIGMEYPMNNEQLTINKKYTRGYFVDTAVTVAVGEIPDEVKKLIDVTREALEVGIKAVKIGGTIADIGKAIEAYVRSQGDYGIVRDLVGHGVGHAVHEDPRVPNYYDKDLERWKIEPGVVIAIEPMITLGGYRVTTADDGWTISTQDKSLNAHFEHTVVVTESGVGVVTRRPSEL